MKKISSAMLLSLALGLSTAAVADSAGLSSNRDPQMASLPDSTVDVNNKKRVLWEPHLRIFNDTKNLIVVYTSSSKMTYYPGDVKDPYYGLLTWGAQNVIMLDKTSGNVFYDKRVVDETFLHITSADADGKSEYTVTVEPMHDQSSAN